MVWIGRALGVTSPRRAAVLAVVVCASVMSVAVPLQNYLGQQAEIAKVRSEREILADQVAELERRQQLLSDPQHTEAQARERLRYVHPGETPYVVQLPPPTAAVAPAQPQGPEPQDPWYTRLWRSIAGDGR
ncbi:MAG: FtsB family cell division protein [Pseudonocardiaceae bacterium]